MLTAALLAHEENAAAFSSAARRGALISYELPFIISTIGMPPHVRTRASQSPAASSAASGGGVSAFFRRMLGGADDAPGACAEGLNQERDRPAHLTIAVRQA